MKKIIIEIDEHDLYDVERYSPIGITLQDRVYRAIQNGKPAQESQGTGKWIVYKDCEGKTRRCVCDRCGYETGKYTWVNPNFCENCGAKMKGEQNDKRRNN